MDTAGIARQSSAMTKRVPPHLYFVTSAVFHYLGPAFAVLLFARVGVLGVAWLRIASAAAIFAAWRRPWRALAGLDRRAADCSWRGASVLAVMNACFYIAIDRLPLGTVAAIEFLPVVVLAALGARTARNAAALLLAVGGVYLLTDVQLVAQPLGVAFAFANAVLFSPYIVLAHRASRYEGMSGIDGLGAAHADRRGRGHADRRLGGRCRRSPTRRGCSPAVGVGVSSSVIPYVTDQLAMRRLPRPTYALMVSLLPATATVIGMLVLAQVPTAGRGRGCGRRGRGDRHSPRADGGAMDPRAGGRASAKRGGRRQLAMRRRSTRPRSRAPADRACRSRRSGSSAAGCAPGRLPRLVDPDAGDPELAAGLDVVEQARRDVHVTRGVGAGRRAGTPASGRGPACRSRSRRPRSRARTERRSAPSTRR